MGVRIGPNGPEQVGPADPAYSLKAVTPHATQNLPDGVCRGLYIGVSGDVVLKGADDDAYVTLKGAAVGYHPIAVKAVRSTGTSATDIVALY